MNLTGSFAIFAAVMRAPVFERFWTTQGQVIPVPGSWIRADVFHSTRGVFRRSNRPDRRCMRDPIVFQMLELRALRVNVPLRTAVEFSQNWRPERYRDENATASEKAPARDSQDWGLARANDPSKAVSDNLPKIADYHAAGGPRRNATTAKGKPRRGRLRAGACGPWGKGGLSRKTLCHIYQAAGRRGRALMTREECC